MKIVVSLLLMLVLVHGDVLDDIVATFLGTNNRQLRDSIFEDIANDKRPLLFTDVNSNDIYLNVPQVLTKNDYPAETYTLKTEDGYLITIHRIPHGKKKPAQPSQDVVVLFRALFSNTYQYLFLGPEKAIGYNLADLGYDVWMVEMRGNSYSKAHVNLPPNNGEFWNMSWDDMGTYDVPAAISFVLNKTGVDKLFVGGHSMGTTALFVGLSVHPWLNEKVRLMIGLGPVTYTAHMRGVLGIVGKMIPEMIWQLIPYQAVLSFTAIDVVEFLWKNVCDTERPGNICTLIKSILEAHYTEIQNMTVLSAYIPESDSTKTVAHYLQGVKSEKFQRYDYGTAGNMKNYGRRTPPEYDLSKITAPVALFASKGDIYADIEDCKTLVSELPNVVLFDLAENESFTHVDFVAGESAPEQVYQHVYSIMEEY